MADASFPRLPNLDRSSSDEKEAEERSFGVFDGTSSNTTTTRAQLHDHKDQSSHIPRRMLSTRGTIPTPEDLGYEDAAPTSPVQRKQSSDGDAASAAADLGYGSGSPTVGKVHTYDGTRVPRRSSLKGAAGSSPSMEARMQRRASMGCASTSMVQVRVRGERYPVQRRRSIDFQNTVEVKEVTPVTDSVSSSDLWIQPDDFAKMKTERRAIVAKHKQKIDCDNDKEDIRGLEKYLDRSGRILKNRAWDTVLLEQDEQELSGIFNDQKIADLYKSTTFQSPDKAAALAQKDQEAIQDYLMSPRTTKLMMRRLSC